MRFLGFTLLLLVFFSCSKVEKNSLSLIDFVPKNASIIIKTSNLEDLKSSIKNSDFLDKFSKTTAYKHLENNLDYLKLLKPNGELLICFSNDEKDSLQFSIITKYTPQLFKSDSLKNYIEEKLTYKKQTLIKSTYNNNTFYSTVTDSIFLAASSKDLINTVSTNSYMNEELVKIYNSTSNDKTFSIIINANSPFVKSFFIEESLNLSAFTNYVAVDVDVNQDYIYMNGITKATDSTKILNSIFKNTIPQENQTQNITPFDSDGFMSFSFKNFKTIEGNLKTFKKKDSITSRLSIFDNIIEVGIIYQDESRAIVLNSIDFIDTEDALIGEQTVTETYRGVEIYSFSQPKLFVNTFSPLVNDINPNRYCILDNFFVFSSHLDLLQNIISNYQNKTTLNELDAFKNTKEQLSNASSLLLVVNNKSLKSILDKNFKDNLDDTFNNYSASALQFIYDSNFAHVNAIIKKSKIRATQNSVSEELNIKLASNILNKPQFVTNHLTNTKEIVVQDIKNNLYLISNKGKILWKKQLEGAVLGTIEQIDIFKNGRLQLAFATPHRVYVIDRNGKDVAPFPGNFNDEITQPLSVFDYDRNKEYRLLVTQGKNILMYDVKAQTVNGFNFNSAKDVIISQPKHFRLRGKDYIVFKTQNKLYIIDRVGNTRITPKTSTNFSNQPIFLYNDAFTTTTSNGQLISVDTQGGVATQNLNLGEKHKLEASSKTLVTLNENKLTIKTNSIELDYGTYTRPELFYIKDKIYVAITDLQTQKVSMYDSLGNLLPNFPVYGNSEITLDNIDKDNSLEFVTKGDANSILLYRIN
ncbi:ribonuclease HII [Mariniflexile litorale]|uniref:Ribonuclease HII n=1 Tax=Mariniflexile litorale TaxID=3045158 RepID=A0AAU7EBC9_9FLAO|nr:ribonuclease HII [Mariniflexile sp. KMM 9835]MDQ8213378.1 ribonuclease HII [Mariniflexile sp. KMM 9835]